MRTFMILALIAAFFPPLAAAQDKKPANDPKKLLARLLDDVKQTKDVDRQVQAAMGLADFGSDAAPALPALLAALESKNEDLRLNSAIVLGKIGKASVAPLAELLDTGDKDVRFYAIWALGWVGPEARDVAPTLIKAMADKDDNIRRKAAYSLGRIAASPAKTIAVLLAAFKDGNEDVRQAASDALAKFGTEAVPGLITALTKGDARVRNQAALAVAEMGADARDAAPMLRELLLGKDNSNRHSYSHALAKLGKTGVPALIEAFKDDRSDVQQAAMQSLQEVGADAVPALVDALSDKKVEVRRMSAQVLAPLRVSDKMVVTALAYAVKNDTDEQVRLQCVNALQQLGISGKLASPALKEALADTNPNVRMTAYWALQNMGENPRDGFRKALANKDDRIRINTAALMLMVNVDANDAVPVLVAALKHENDEVQIQAAHALAQAGREAGKLLPFFKDGLKSKTARVRVQALSGLQMLNQQAGPAANEIIGALKDADGSVRLQAVHTLHNVPANAEATLTAVTAMFKEEKNAQARIAIVQLVPRYQAKAMPLLLEAIKDGDAQVRQQAVWGMQNTGGDLSAYHAEVSALVKDTDANVRVGLVQVLSRTGEKGVLLLGDMLKDPNEQVRWQAAAALQNAGKRAAKVLPALTEAVNDKNANVRWQAAFALAQLGEEGSKALFKAYSDSKEPDVRIQIIQAQFNSPARNHTLPLLRQALKDRDSGVRRFAVQMVPSLGATKEAIEVLTEAMKEKELDVRVAAAYSLQNLGPKSLPILEQELGSAKEAELRQAILNGLINQNSRSKTLVAPLTACLKDGQAPVRWMAAHVLGNIGPDARDAVPALESLLEDRDTTVRQNVQNALKRIRQ
jgi:HEAT repeat protein